MPAFTVISVSDGSYGCSALQVVPWQVVGTADHPSQVASRDGSPELRYRMHPGGVCLQCVVGGVLAPLDSALVLSPPPGGLFSPSLAEGAVQPTWLPSPPDRSSIIRARFDWVGHYAIAIRMVGGGTHIVPFDVEPS